MVQPNSAASLSITMKTACAGVMVLLVLAAAMGAESRSVAGEVQEVASNKLNSELWMVHACACW